MEVSITIEKKFFNEWPHIFQKILLLDKIDGDYILFHIFLVLNKFDLFYNLDHLYIQAQHSNSFCILNHVDILYHLHSLFFHKYAPRNRYQPTIQKKVLSNI